MSEKKYLIYKFTSPSGKSYVGQTSDLKRRTYQHKVYKRCSVFHSAIIKYSIENFKLEILMSGLTISQANYFEGVFISELNTIHPFGYNLMTGGFNSEHTQEFKDRASLRMKGNQINKGRCPSKETRKKLSEARTGVIFSDTHKKNMSISAKNKPKFSEQHIKNLSESHKGKVLSRESIEKRTATLKKNKEKKRLEIQLSLQE